MAIWSTDNESKQNQYDAWCGQLGQIFGLWTPDLQNASNGYNAQSEVIKSENAQLIECICQPCGAIRTRKEIDQDNRGLVTIQVVKSGEEHFDINGKQYRLTGGDVIIWNDSQPIKFNVTSHLHKTSLSFPHARLKAWLEPNRRKETSYFPKDSATATMLRPIILNSLKFAKIGSLSSGNALIETVLGALMAVGEFTTTDLNKSRMRSFHMERVSQVILQELSNPSLNPQMISEAANLSVRYLHDLFKEEKLSLNEFIIQSRLEKCRQDLMNPIFSSRSVTEISFFWGFQSSSHFSRRFRSSFEQSPIECRNTAL